MDKSRSHEGETAAPSDAESVRRLAEQFGLEFVSEIRDDMFDPGLVADLPVEWARAQLILPVRMDGSFRALVADPENLGAQKQLELLLNRELVPVLASRETILNGIEKCYFSRKESASEFIRDLGESVPEASAARRPAADLLQMSENAPVTQLINLILLEAIKAGASDVHIEPYEARLKIRYRIDGMLYDQASPPKHLEAPLISRLKVMARMDIAEKRLPQDGVARVNVGKRQIDIRVSTVPIAEGERVVLRLLHRNSTLLPLEGLGMGPDILGKFSLILRETSGIVLVCGPTGSGKTTTLYASLQQLDKTRINIMTVEDPIEYALPDIGQIQVKPKIGLTFASGLRHILRQDPDVILVGEIRDLETAEIAIRASLTGHLVFSTLHTNDAPSAVTRLTDMGLPAYLCAASLRAVMAQRLARRLCRACRSEIAPPEEIVALVGRRTPQAAGLRAIWEPAGCAECLEGYRGRIGFFEMMEISPAIAEAIRVGHTNTAMLRRMAIEHGMRTMLDDALSKLAAGETSASEIMRTVGRAGD